MIRAYIQFLSMFLIRIALVSGPAILAGPGLTLLWDVTLGHITNTTLGPLNAIAAMIGLVAVVLAVQTALHTHYGAPVKEGEE